MRIETKEWNWDLILIISLSILFSIVMAAMPQMKLLRLVLGIPYLIFVPGYIFSLIIFPRKKIDVVDDKNENTKKLKGRKGPKINFRKGAHRDNKEEDIEEETQMITRKGIQTITRISISFPLSIGIVSIIGILLNWAYGLNSSLFGLREYTILISLYLFTMLFSFIALIRRERLPKEERPYIRIKIGPFTDGSNTDKFITSTLVTMITLAAGVGYYLYKDYHENEKFTELYLLGPGKMIDEYPSIYYVNEIQNVQIGITNNEYEKENYTVKIYKNNLFGEETLVSDFFNLNLSENRIFTKNIVLDHEDSIILPFSYWLSDPGLYFIKCSIFKDGFVYREVMIKNQVFDPDDLITEHNRDFKYFITGPMGIPEFFPEELRNNNPLNVEIGLINDHNRTQYINLSVSISSPANWTSFNITSHELLIDKENGYFIYQIITPGSHSIFPADIYLPKGDWNVEFTIQRDTSDLVIERSIKVI